MVGKFIAGPISRYAVFIVAALLGLGTGMPAKAGDATDALGRQVEVSGSASRIITLGSDVTEIVYALGAGERVVAVDRGSHFPSDTSTKENVGYRRQLSAENLIGLHPDLILAAEDIGPIETVDILLGLNIPIVFVPEDNSIEGIERKITLVSTVLDRQQEGRDLAKTVRANSEEAVALSASIPEAKRKKVVFFHGLVRLSAAGAGTAADAIIKLAGGVNPMDEVQGYQAASEERLVEMAPDVILMMSNANGGPTHEEVFSNRALSASPAAQTGSLVVLDGAYMIGFGPRTADAIRDLAHALYGETLTPSD